MGKTEIVFFGSKRKLNKYNDFFLLYLVIGKPSGQNNLLYNLGLELNQYLDGEQIILNIVKKVNSRLKFLYRQANHFNQKVKKMICSALVLCLFDYYLSLVWKHF